MGLLADMLKCFFDDRAYLEICGHYYPHECAVVIMLPMHVPGRVKMEADSLVRVELTITSKFPICVRSSRPVASKTSVDMFINWLGPGRTESLAPHC